MEDRSMIYTITIQANEYFLSADKKAMNIYMAYFFVPPKQGILGVPQFLLHAYLKSKREKTTHTPISFF